MKRFGGPFPFAGIIQIRFKGYFLSLSRTQYIEQWLNPRVPVISTPTVCVVFQVVKEQLLYNTVFLTRVKKKMIKIRQLSILPKKDALFLSFAPFYQQFFE
jgi:hypothetical protein